ncbi:MAG: ion transporter [Deltaproteobacteria bacterium]|nr:ion transporter [Deltaproteobacteria bacterium]
MSRTTTPLRENVWRIIFGYDTPAGRAFDVILLVAIVASVLCVMLETVQPIREAWGAELLVAEWVFTVLFTSEYLVRLWVARKPMAYARSFFGVVDLLSILPTYLSLLIPGSQSLLVIRALRLLRVFRVLKLSRYLGEANVLTTALRSSGYKVTIFLGTVLVLVTILGTLMYLVEGAEHGFTSIPRSVYWAVVTLTTVGYGDIAPSTTLGQVLASVVMLLGYCIIAVPTGIVSAEMVRSTRSGECGECGVRGHEENARYCRLCAAPLESDRP